MTKQTIFYNNRSGCVQICNNKLYKFVIFDSDCDNQNPKCNGLPPEDKDVETKFLKKNEVQHISPALFIWTDGQNWYLRYTDDSSLLTFPVNTNCLCSQQFVGILYKTIIKNA
jgi:hypothetical protein